MSADDDDFGWGDEPEPAPAACCPETRVIGSTEWACTRPPHQQGLEGPRHWFRNRWPARSVAEHPDGH